MLARFVCGVTNDRIFFFLLRLNNTLLYNHIFFMHSLVSGYLGCLHMQASVNDAAAMNAGAQVTFGDNDFVSFGCIARSAIAVSCGSSIFNFLKTLHTIFPSESIWKANYLSELSFMKISCFFFCFSLQQNFWQRQIATRAVWIPPGVVNGVATRAIWIPVLNSWHWQEDCPGRDSGAHRISLE